MDERQANNVKQNKLETQERIKQAAELIRYHQDKYYNAIPEISDDEFDVLWDRLRKLDPEHSLITAVGRDQSNFFTKKRHLMPMSSLDKLTTEEEIDSWVNAHPSDEYILEHKLDGASLELQYRDGRLIHAVTRGNGIIGDDIFVNARQMNGVNLNLSEEYSSKFGELAVRGEVTLHRDVFEAHFKDSKANPRNTANGIMRRKDGKFCNLLNVYCYDLWTAQGIGAFTEQEKLLLLSKMSFSCVEYQVCKTAASLIKARQAIMQKRLAFPVDIDGIVIKSRLSQEEDMLSLRPKLQIAVKFPLERVITVLKDVYWSPSGHNYTPVALLEPVKIAGTTVKRANLVHLELIQKMGIRIGSEVEVVKRGEIIPKVEKCIYTPANAAEIKAPAVCEICGQAIVLEQLKVYCPNMYCKKRVLYRLSKWFASLEIDNWGDETLAKLVLEYAKVSKLGDLYRLTDTDLRTLPKFGDILIKKLLDSLHQKKEIDFVQLIAGLGIEGISTLTAQQLVKHGIHSWQQLRAATIDDLVQIENFAEKSSKKLIEASLLLDEEVKDLLNFISIKRPALNAEAGPLDGKSFCITGELSKPRKELISFITSHGGSFDSTIKKTTSYLVTNDENSQSSKAKQARSQGTKLINEEKLFAFALKS